MLAGVTMALLTGGRTPLRGRDRWRASLGVALRAVLVGVVGLWLGGLDTGLAVILTYYAVLFLLGLPFAGLRARSLAVLAVVWLVSVPLASQWVRPRLPEPSYDNPSWAGLGDPVQLGSELLLTGYYPALPWLAYLLAGTAVGRSDLGRRGVQAGWLVGGLVLATVAGVGSRVLAGREFGPRVLEEASLGLPGTTPTDRWSYLLLDAPHSGTPFDLAATTGSALAVIGGSLLLVGVLPGLGVRFLAVVFGAGTMTLTLYTLHAVLRTDTVLAAGRRGLPTACAAARGDRCGVRRAALARTAGAARRAARPAAATEPVDRAVRRIGMKSFLAPLVALLPLLAACGAEGAPPPADDGSGDDTALSGEYVADGLAGAVLRGRRAARDLRGGRGLLQRDLQPDVRHRRLGHLHAGRLLGRRHRDGVPRRRVRPGRVAGRLLHVRPVDHRGRHGRATLARTAPRSGWSPPTSSLPAAPDPMSPSRARTGRSPGSRRPTATRSGC